METYKGDNLIFIISQPRSGSTLLQRILSNHPSIETEAEPWLLLPFLFNNFEINFIPNRMPYASRTCRTGINNFIDNYSNKEEAYKNALRSFFKVLYEEKLRKKSNYFLDKTPRYYYIIEELYALFPEAKYIFLHRNPAAVLTSIIKTWCPNNLLKLGQFRDDLFEAPNRIQDSLRKHKNNSYSIYYEDIITKPEETLKGLSIYLGLVYDENSLNIKKLSSKWILGDSDKVYRYETPEKTRAHGWEEDLRSPWVRRILYDYLSILGPKCFKNARYNGEEIKEKITSKGNINLVPLGIRFFCSKPIYFIWKLGNYSLVFFRKIFKS